MSDLNALRDGFVDTFNARDLDGIADLMRSDVSVPDAPGAEGADVLVNELQVLWQRTPQVIATPALLDGTPAAMLWVPVEARASRPGVEARASRPGVEARASRPGVEARASRWARSVVVVLNSDAGLLVLMDLLDDPDALERAGTADPTGDELAEWDDWREWNVGDEVARDDRS